VINVRRSGERGHAHHDWLDTWHTFSFANYYDPAYVGFRSLRVINEDTVSPGGGFGTHPHSDMEIVTYVLDGTLSHRDSLGSRSTIEPGELQRMSAGRGLTHSEYNASSTDPVHFLQLWIRPATRGGDPSYEQKRFDLDANRAQLTLLVSPDGRHGSLTIGQSAMIYASRLDSREVLSHETAADRYAWVQVVRGTVILNGVRLERGDGAAVSDVARLAFEALELSEFLLIEMD